MRSVLSIRPSISVDNVQVRVQDGQSRDVPLFGEREELTDLVVLGPGQSYPGHLLEEVLSGVLVSVSGYPDDLKVVSGLQDLVVSPDEFGGESPARSAPGSREVETDVFSFQVVQSNSVTVNIIESSVKKSFNVHSSDSC